MPGQTGCYVANAHRRAECTASIKVAKEYDTKQKCIGHKDVAACCNDPKCMYSFSRFPGSTGCSVADNTRSKTCQESMQRAGSDQQKKQCAAHKDAGTCCEDRRCMYYTSNMPGQTGCYVANAHRRAECTASIKVAKEYDTKQKCIGHKDVAACCNDPKCMYSFSRFPGSTGCSVADN